MDLQDGREHLFQEVTWLRRAVRTWVATANANRSRWYGGSWVLHEAAYWAQLSELLMCMRRLVVTGRRNEYSLHRVLSAAVAQEDDQEREAALRSALTDVESLQGSDAWHHTKQLIDKTIAHPAGHQLSEGASRIDGLSATSIRLKEMVEVVDRISKIFQVLEPALVDLDDSGGGPDPLRKRTRAKGLPGISFKAGEIYRTDECGRDTAFMSVCEQEWNAVVATCERPWPPGVALLDYRMGMERWRLEGAKPQGHPSSEVCAQRWGWDEMDVLRAMEEWERIRPKQREGSESTANESGVEE